METARLSGLGEALDAIGRRAEASLGEADVAHVRRIDRISRRMELAGRVLLHLSFEPAGFFAGVGCLWVGKQLHAGEIGHTVLHGVYDRLAGAGRWRAASFRWRTPLDEDVWSYLHNVRHHGWTNVAGKDMQYGLLELHERLPGLPRRTRRALIAKLAAKLGPYYAREYLLFPALAGPLFWKVLLGNWMSEVMRDVYSVVTIYCNHDGHDVAYFPEGTRAASKAEWYRMQIEATNNFEVPRWVSLLCGGLELHIEHHLFPRLPPNRLREIAPRVRRACEAHGVRYKTASWPRTLAKVARHYLTRGQSAPRPRRRSSVRTASSSLASCSATDLFSSARRSR